MATVSYGMKINSENRIVDRTIGIYRDAVKYLMEIVSMHYDELAAISGTSTASVQQLKQQYIEKLVHSTKFNHAKYTEFDRRFYKFPSYLRRDAITTAIGKIMSYQSMVCNWESKGRTGKRPFLNKTQDVMPCFYRKNTFLQDQNKISLKLFNGKDWVWHRMTVRNSDFLYALKNVYDWKACAPVLQKCGHRYELRIAYEKPSSSFPRYKKDVDVEAAVSVDLGINTDAVCSVVHKDGTVTGQTFINSPVEKDRMYGLLNAIRKAQQHGNYRNHRLWRFVNNYNEAIAVKTSCRIIEFALKSNASVIVFEHLDMKRKKKVSRKQKVALWRKREIQRRVEAMGARCGIRVSYICAVNTSRLAYDGSGKVVRGSDAGFKSNKLCRFQNGKVYNCDLSASKNIGARYFTRVILKSLSESKRLSILAKVPGLDRRTSCVLATLINLYAELYPVKAASVAV